MSKKVLETPEKKAPKSSSKQKPAADKKIAQYKNKLASKEQECAELKDRLLRTAAELDNYRRRTERERIDIVKSANATLLRELLPVIDDFERSLKICDEEIGSTDFRRGIELIYQKLLEKLKAQGLTAMHSEGEPFDVDKHDALLEQKKKGVKPGLVIDEHEKGYYLNGRILRHAKVIVSK
jgi:molecular chaperone GrpE